MRIVTWNVNGIRACGKKGFLDWLRDESPDAVCLQEIKALPEQVPPELREPEGYHAYWAPAERKGYSGVALFSKKKPEAVELGLGEPEFDCEGRTLIADYGRFVLATSYFPNSQREHARLPYKLAYDAALEARLEAFRAEGREVIVCGDFNAAHEEIDLANPKQNVKNAGFLPEERAWVTHMLELGWQDVFRDRHPGENGHYTWWTYRMNARARNIGWRLDYFLCTPGIAAKVKDVVNLTEVQGSDHCPVRLDLKKR